SVDDYLRVSLASKIANHWAWFPDPFLLPFHAWIHALAFKMGCSFEGSTIGLTIVWAGISTGLLYLLALKLGASVRTAVVVALLASLEPLALWLGGVPLSETLGLVLLLGSLVLWNE